MRIEPPPSLPCAIDTMPAATPAALPPDEPPGVREVSHGLRAGPKRSGSLTGRIPISGRLVLPTTIAPAARSLRTVALSSDGTQSPIARMPIVVRTLGQRRQVLHQQRHARQRPVVPRAHGVSPSEGALVAARHHGVQVGVEPVDRGPATPPRARAPTPRRSGPSPPARSRT